MTSVDGHPTKDKNRNWIRHVSFGPRWRVFVSNRTRSQAVIGYDIADILAYCRANDIGPGRLTFVFERALLQEIVKWWLPTVKVLDRIAFLDRTRCGVRFTICG